MPRVEKNFFADVFFSLFFRDHAIEIAINKNPNTVHAIKGFSIRMSDYMALHFLNVIISFSLNGSNNKSLNHDGN